GLPRRQADRSPIRAQIAHFLWRDQRAGVPPRGSGGPCAPPCTPTLCALAELACVFACEGAEAGVLPGALGDVASPGDAGAGTEWPLRSGSGCWPWAVFTLKYAQSSYRPSRAASSGPLTWV